MDEDQDSKTEAPSQRKRDEALQQGNVVFSLELNTGMTMLIGILFLWFGGSAIALGFEASIHESLRYAAPDLSFERVQALLMSQLGTASRLIGGFLGVMFVAALGVSVGQVGFHVSSEALGPKLEKIDPVAGLFRLLSKEGLVRGLLALAKVTAIGAIAYWMLSGKGVLFLNLASLSLKESVGVVWHEAMKLLAATVVALIALGVGDFVFQWWRHERSLMMTKEQVRQESKDDEGNPQIKARRRQIAREIASRKRMLRDVPEATVVVTNPTHIAVAMKYERGKMSAPLVVATGKGAFARRIVTLAKRHSVPVLERKPLAQALFKAVKVGQEIPLALYYAVSEVLAYVYKLRHG